MIILKLVLWLIPIGINVWFARKRQKPEYLVQFILRVMASIIHGSLFVSGTADWPVYLVVVIFQVTSFWILFEVVLNFIWGEHPLYFDHKEKDSGYIDRFFAWMGETGWVLHFIAKAFALILCVLSVIVILYQA